MIGVVMAGGRGSRMAASCAADARASAAGPESEKLLLAVMDAAGGQDVPVVQHVIGAMTRCSVIDRVYVAASHVNAPLTRKMLERTYCNDQNVSVIDTKGSGYARDLYGVLRHISEQQQQNRDADAYDRGAIIVSGDMPYLDADVISTVSSHYAKDAWTVIVITKEYAAMWDTDGTRETAMLQDVAHDSGSGSGPCHCCYTGVSLVDPHLVASSQARTNIAQRHVIINDHRIAHSLNTIGDYDRLVKRK